MIKQLFIAVVLAIAGTTAVLGQTVSGRVVDEAGRGIAYVNIGIANQPGGTVSDASGGFSIQLHDSICVDTWLTFSHLSYEIKNINVSEARNFISEERDLAVMLSPRVYAIDCMLVVAGSSKEVKFARKGFPGPGFAYPTIEGEEIGSVIGVDGNIRLSAVEFKVLRCTHQSARIRINVYRIEPDTLMNILHAPIYCDVPARDKSGIYRIEPDEAVVLGTGEYFVSLEFVELNGDGQLRFPVFLHKSYTRESSLDRLKELPVNIGIAVSGFRIPRGLP